MSAIRLDAADAVELIEVCELLIDWLDRLTARGFERLPLADPAYQITDLRDVLDRCHTQLLNTKIWP